MRSNIFFILFSASLLTSSPVYAASAASIDPKLTDETWKSLKYSFPSASTEVLQRSSIFISCGESNASGIAISRRHFLTAAHNICGFVVSNAPIHIMIPITKHPVKTLDVEIIKAGETPQPIIQPISTEDFKYITATRVHLPKSTRIDSPATGKPMRLSKEHLSKMSEQVLNSLKEDAYEFAESGVGQTWLQHTSEGYIQQRHGAFGPDIAIIECEEDHGVSPIAIANSSEPEDTLFIAGFTGRRYDSTKKFAQYAGGVGRDKSGKLKLLVKPEIYAQHFISLPASTTNETHRLWINKVPLSIQSNGLPLFEDEFLPMTPEGFGLITSGDSGAGAAMLQDGVPYLAGIASKGDLPDFVQVISRYVEQCVTTNDISEITLACIETLKKPWFIIEALTDETFNFR